MGSILSPDDEYKNASNPRQEHGAIILDGQQVASTLQCPHCGSHFVSRKGSGKRRTWCLRCNAVTCGQHTCDPCIPFEKRLDICEKVPGLDISQVPAYLLLHPEIKVTVL